MPRDFTQTELESLLDEFGPIHQCFLIHSEISGDFLCSITLSVQKLIKNLSKNLSKMPRDFTQTELESLLYEFGPIHQCFLIHSEISVIYCFIGPKIDPKSCPKSVQKLKELLAGLLIGNWQTDYLSLGTPYYIVYN